MNTASDAASRFPLDAPHAAPDTLAATRPFYWSVRRELWENRSIYVLPLAVAAIFLFAFLISTLNLPHNVNATLALDAEQQRDMLQKPYMYAALLIMGAAFAVGIFYSLEALHGERRDRSILFWKSLPVSDVTTVLAKASIPILVLPLISFVLTVATQWLMLMLSTAVLLGNGAAIKALWTQVPLVSMSVMLFFHLVAIHGLWYAPIYGWLLLASAWARRAAFLWAALPLVAIQVIEKVAFNTSHFGMMLQNRVMGGPGAADSPGSAASMDAMIHVDLLGFLTSPGLWIGLLLAAACLAGAVYLRRNREPV
jgi:ABC-2 type transport system permease protein